jgi:hypothetical protein
VGSAYLISELKVAMDITMKLEAAAEKSGAEIPSRVRPLVAAHP